MISSISSIVGRKTESKQSKADSNENDFWVDVEVTRLCAGLSVALLSIRRAVVILIETHRFGDQLLAQAAIKFLIENADVIFVKDILLQDLVFRGE